MIIKRYEYYKMGLMDQLITPDDLNGIDEEKLLLIILKIKI